VRSVPCAFLPVFIVHHTEGHEDEASLACCRTLRLRRGKQRPLVPRSRYLPSPAAGCSARDGAQTPTWPPHAPAILGRLHDYATRTPVSSFLRCKTAAERHYGVSILSRARVSVRILHNASRKRSVASTNALKVPFSDAECPASGTTTSSASGNALCNSHALVIGHSTS
jgi:hypothetical protein